MSAEKIVETIRSGYRYFDTSAWPKWAYNESSLGEAVLSSGLPREAFTLQSKVAPVDLGPKATPRAIEKILAELQTSYVDILLIHWTSCTPDIGDIGCELEYREADGDWRDAWAAMEDAYLQGQAKAIGFSNVDASFLQDLLADPKLRVKPALVQDSLAVSSQDRETRTFCQTHDIVFQGYGMLHALDQRVLQHIADCHEASPAQVVLRWEMYRNVSALMTSSNPDHINANRQLDFDLSPSELEAIDALDDGESE